MDLLIVQALQNLLNEEGARRLAAWRRAAPENHARFRELEEMWNVSARLGQERSDSLRPSAAAIDRLARERRESRASFFRSRFGVRFGVAAASVAALLAVGFGVVQLEVGAGDTLDFGPGEFLTGRSEMATVELTDGTVVRLAPDSRLRVHRPSPRRGEPRELFLKGRAYFAVAPVANHPFIVRTDIGNALALGTRFEVRADAEELKVTVVEGRVAVSTSGDTANLTAGQVSRTRRGDATSEVTWVRDPLASLGWLRGLLVFQETPVIEALAEIEEHHGSVVRVVNNESADHRISVWFVDESFEETVSVVCRIVGARCTIEPGSATVELPPR